MSSSSTISSSHGVAIATAAMAVSGTVLLLALRLQKTPQTLRSCLSSDEKRSERKKKKRVRFAEDVVEPSGDSEIFRRRHVAAFEVSASSEELRLGRGGRKVTEMPSNRLALYNGMLRDRRVSHRAAAYS